jgi:proprotein convertase subtilisin/kexin type 5
MTTTLNQEAADESWGIRDFFIFVEKCPAGCTICNEKTLKTCSGLKQIDSSWLQNKEP